MFSLTPFPQLSGKIGLLIKRFKRFKLPSWFLDTVSQLFCCYKRQHQQEGGAQLSSNCCCHQN